MYRNHGAAKRRNPLFDEIAHEMQNEPLPLKEVERRHLMEVLDYCGNNLTATAHVLGIARSTLYNKLIEYGLR